MTELEEIDPVVAENQRLRRALYLVVAERNKAATKLTGVQNLGQQLQKKEQENSFLKEKLERLEGTLARAENRITQLNLQAGNGANQAFSRGGIVTPGVSKKILEALTRENTRLNLALEHMNCKGSNGNGSDLAVENRELHEIIMSLREERDQKIIEADELKRALAAIQDENVDVLKNQVLLLTTNVTKLERNLSAKQVFSETVVAENERLKELMHLLRNEKITEVNTLKRELGDLTETQPDVRKILSEVYVGEDGADGYTQESRNAEQAEILLKNVNSLRQQCEKYKQQIGELQLKADEIPILKHEVDTKTAELRTIQLQNDAMHEENEKDRRKLMEEQETLKDKLDNVRRELNRKEVELNELQMVHNLMQESLANYEHDFKIEREEKMKAVSDREQCLRERDQILQRYEQLKREHITLRQNIERMYSQAQQKTQPPRRQLSGGRQTCGAQIKEPWQQQAEMRARGFGMEACADGPGDFTDAPITPPKETPTPSGSRRYSSQGSQLQCPYCGKNFPHDLLENHMRDCTGDD